MPLKSLIQAVIPCYWCSWKIDASTLHLTKSYRGEFQRARYAKSRPEEALQFCWRFCQSNTCCVDCCMHTLIMMLPLSPHSKNKNFNFRIRELLESSENEFSQHLSSCCRAIFNIYLLLLMVSKYWFSICTCFFFFWQIHNSKGWIKFWVATTCNMINSWVMKSFYLLALIEVHVGLLDLV